MPRSQLRNSSTRSAWPSRPCMRFRKIGSSSITRSTGLPCAAHSASSRSPCRCQLPPSRPPRIFTLKSPAPISSKFAVTNSFMDAANRNAIGRTRCTALAIPATASSAHNAPSTSTKKKIQPSFSSRRPSSCRMLVLPMRRWPLSSTWFPSRIFVASISISASRSKKSSPLTQRPVEDLIGTLTWSSRRHSMFNNIIVNDSVVNNAVEYGAEIIGSGRAAFGSVPSPLRLACWRDDAPRSFVSQTWDVRQRSSSNAHAGGSGNRSGSSHSKDARPTARRCNLKPSAWTRVFSSAARKRQGPPKRPRALRSKPQGVLEPIQAPAGEISRRRGTGDTHPTSCSNCCSTDRGRDPRLFAPARARCRATFPRRSPVRRRFPQPSSPSCLRQHRARRSARP